MNLTQAIRSRQRIRRRLYAIRPQASPQGLTPLRGAIVIAECMVAAFVAWAAMVLLLVLT